MNMQWRRLGMQISEKDATNDTQFFAFMAPLPRHGTHTEEGQTFYGWWIKPGTNRNPERFH